ncbi:MAG: ankyrin repeat domain-containing protein [Verrucomicrobia bacterium]|nr:ankyrin repeat domain-containing protein [Verrucomicrobiota bacterium]
MKTSDIKNPVFKAAVEAIDGGKVHELRRLVAQNPALLSERLVNGEQGYFKDPYLLYFVADNPIRMEKLPVSIVEVTVVLVGELKRLEVVSLQEQLDYTLGLVATGRIPRECGVQLAIMDLLMDAGAKPGGGLGALAHGNVDAARRLIECGGALTLGTAVGLERGDDVRRMAPAAGQDERLVALTVAAFYGKQEWIAFLLALGVDPNDYPKSEGFHSHATPLHQAVSSGSLAAVKLLVEAGADLALKDKIYGGTAWGWAGHMLAEEREEALRNQHAAIAEYLERKATGPE